MRLWRDRYLDDISPELSLVFVVSPPLVLFNEVIISEKYLDEGVVFCSLCVPRLGQRHHFGCVRRPFFLETRLGNAMRVVSLHTVRDTIISRLADARGLL